MPTFGTIKRAKPRIRVRKGYSPVEPSNLHEAYTPDSDADIKSGMLLVLDNSVDLLKKATAALLAAGNRPYFALEDQSAPDVSASGKLPVIVCNGNFEVETAFFDAGSYSNGDLLGASAANAGNVAAHPDNGTPSVGSAKGIRSWAPDATRPNYGINNEADPTTFNGDVLALYTEHRVDLGDA